MFISFIEKNKEKIFILILLALFFYRSPFIFLNGRFMAEEGSVYFANAYKFDFLYSLLFVDFTSGYFNLWSNISGIIANLFDLKFAPLVSNYLALIPKILIIILALYSKSILLTQFHHKVLFCLLVFLSPLNVPEIWMNSINSQIFFGIIAFILILIHYEKSKVNYFHLILITISGFSGIYSCILLPAFFLKYLIYKSKQNLLNFLCIFVCTSIQLILISYGKLSNILYEGKIHVINFDLITNYIYNVLIKAFLGTSFTKFLYYNYLSSNLNLYLISIIIILSFVIVSFFLYNFLIKNTILNPKNKFIIILVIYSLIATSLVVMTGGVGDYVGGRYAALPSFYLLTTVLVFYIFCSNFGIKFIFLFLLATSILTGIYEFRPSVNNVNYQYLKYLDCMGCPNWQNEITKFEIDKNYRLKIWPYPKKAMYLN
tara:strand:+ start:256 stop:1545 length:1290 start_codon:yes stop_codon:yes gene_type:complete